MITSNVKDIMEDRGITYVELERRTGLSNHTITRARSDSIRECRLYTLEVIAKALGVRIFDLFDDGLGDGEHWEEFPHVSK